MTRRLLYAEAAQELRVTESWLRKNIKRLPHTKVGRTVYFTDADLARIDAQFHHEPGSGLKAPAAGPHPLGHLVPLPSRSVARA